MKCESSSACHGALVEFSRVALNRRKDVRLPVQLQRAMAAEAEAAREARAKVIAAEGEQKASRALKEAAEVIAESPAALQVNRASPGVDRRRIVRLPFAAFLIDFF